MKKLLSLLGAIGFVAATSTAVVACGKSPAKTDIENDVITNHKYEISIENIVPDETNAKKLMDYDDIDEDLKLINNFEENLRGYLNPLFLNLIGDYEIDLDADYEIHGVTAKAIREGLGKIDPTWNNDDKFKSELNNSFNKLEEPKHKSFEISDITVVAKNDAQYLHGEVVLPPISMKPGIDLNNHLKTVEEIVIVTDEYKPNDNEIIEQLNEIVEDNGGTDDQKLKLGHIAFEIDKTKILIEGNGLYYGSFTTALESTKATDIATIITEEEKDLGTFGFIEKPTNMQLLEKLEEKFGEEFTGENLAITNKTNEEASLMGFYHFKGEATIKYNRSIFDLDNIINKDLGELDNPPVDKDDLITKINNANEGLGLKKEFINIAGKLDPENGLSVYIAAQENNDLVTGIAKIVWSIKQYDLNEIIQKRDLGNQKTNLKKEEILKKINELNNLDLVLNEDVIIEDYIDGEDNIKSAIVKAVPNHKKYKGEVVVKWWKIGSINDTNLEKAIRELEARFTFVIKVNTEENAINGEITPQIKKLLEEKYLVSEEFFVECSVFPDEEFLSKVTTDEYWTSPDDASMTFHLTENEESINISVIWTILVIE